MSATALGPALKLQQIINTSLRSAESAVAFIGSGTPTTSTDSLLPADIWLIATPDHAIAPVAIALTESGVLRPGDIVVHCSGALSSEVLGVPTEVLRASVHPSHSFANPEASLLSFAGSACAVEGDDVATQRLMGLFSAIGGRCFTLDRQHKALYHAATVMASNNLVSLLAVSQQMLEAASVSAQESRTILQPLMQNTFSNYLKSNPVAALTGPISRVDSSTVASHLASLEQHPDWRAIYSSLGAAALGIAAQQPYASKAQLDAIARLLDRDSPHE